MLRIKYERIRFGYNQTALAFYAGMSVSDISRIETGRLKPYPAQLEKLSNILDIPPDQLLKEIAPKPDATPVEAAS